MYVCGTCICMYHGFYSVWDVYHTEGCISKVIILWRIAVSAFYYLNLIDYYVYWKVLGMITQGERGHMRACAYF